MTSGDKLQEARPWIRRIVTSGGPGLLASVLLASLAWLTASVGGRLLGLPLSDVAVAVVGGLVVGSLLRSRNSLDQRLRPGISVVADHGLRAAIVLLGARFGLGELVETGGVAVVSALIVIAAAGLSVYIVARMVGVRGRVATLLAVGTGICGNSAIAAVAPLVSARKNEIAFSSTVITLMGTAAMMALPVVGASLGLTEEAMGIVSGAGVHDSAQAVASGFIYGREAGNIATVVKLTRVAFLVPVVLLMTLAVRRNGEPTSQSEGTVGIPLFVIGFVLLSLARTVGDATLGGAELWEGAIQLVTAGSSWLLLLAMAGIGLSTDLRGVGRVGSRSLATGVIAAFSTSAAAFAAALLLV